jgi:hypothetical protein
LGKLGLDLPAKGFDVLLGTIYEAVHCAYALIRQDRGRHILTLSS